MRKYLSIVLISLLITTISYLLGYISTQNVSSYLINTVVGIFIILTISSTLYFASIVYSILLIKGFIKDYDKSDPFIIPNISKDEIEEYLVISDVDNLVKPMDDYEFIQFLNKDRYGGDNPDKEAILNLLEIIKGRDGYDTKEKIIYMKLASLN